MGPLAAFREHRRAILVPVAAWLLLQVVMATGLRAATGGAAEESGEGALLRDLATSLCLVGQSADGETPLPTLHDRCWWCVAFGVSLLPPAPRVGAVAVSVPHRPPLPLRSETSPRAPQRFALFVARAPPV